jgi:non-ribosomal peptide synthetase component F
MYTSGSTGHPKGVTIEHVSLRALVDWHCAAFELCDTDRCTQIASPGFDAAVWEIWPSLSAGASLHIVPEHLRVDPLGLRDWLVAEEITVGFAPTAIAEGLIALEWPTGTALRALLTGGDALTRRPRADLPFTLINNYGVSEATVVATSAAATWAGLSSPPSASSPTSAAGGIAPAIGCASGPAASSNSADVSTISSLSAASGSSRARSWLRSPPIRLWALAR